MRDVILKAENVYFSYDDEKEHALNGLSLEIERGKKVAIMGANGSGKSTFFFCCNGLHKPSSGTVYFHGKPLDYSRKGLLDLRSKVGIVFQDPDNQLFSASVYQEISFGILNKGVLEQEAKEAVEDIIAQMEITPFRHKPTHALSGGQKKQVSIADILVMKPEVIILDEPTAALDPKHTAMVNETMNQLTKEGMTVLMSLHDVDYAMEWADQVLLFHEGILLKAGTPEEVFSDWEALEKTNLHQPSVMRVFLQLQGKNLLPQDSMMPKTVE
ncbi:MAG: ABC transporter ATP-binding protein, partial [Eubacteriales bacterium]